MLAGYSPFYDTDPMFIYQKIMENNYTIPSKIDRHARDIINNLLQFEASNRIGNR